MRKNKIELCDECEFANRDKINKLEAENAELRKDITEIREERDESINNALNLIEDSDRFRATMVQENIELKSRWEKLEKWIVTTKEYDINWHHILEKMQELESGGEVLSSVKPENPLIGDKTAGKQKDASRLGTPKPDSLSLCPKCNCMTKTIHDEEIIEICGKCGEEKSGGESQMNAKIPAVREPKPGRICNEPESSSYKHGCDPGGCDTICIDKKLKLKVIKA